MLSQAAIQIKLETLRTSSDHQIPRKTLPVIGDKNFNILTSRSDNDPEKHSMRNRGI
jgi:hypothetical protein